MEHDGNEKNFRRLYREHNWLQAVVEESPLGILLVEVGKPERIRINRRARELFGSEFDPSQGRHVYARAIRDTANQPIPVEKLASTRALQGETILMEEQIVKHGQDAIPVMVSGSPVRDSEGNLLGAVVIFQEITHLKELERLREEWISIVAHDLRQPLSVISLTLQTLKRLVEPGQKLEKVLSRAEIGTERLKRMINDLLDFSRIEASRLNLEPARIEPVQLVRDFVERLAPQLTHNPIRIEVMGTVPVIEGDVARLEQVLGNLISNAVKYGTADTEIVLKLEGRNGELFISVTNYGQGLSASELTQLFQRFRRFHTDSSKGIGLGLYIAQGIVQAHGGRIWAESTPGQTTTFHVSLPTERPAVVPKFA